jgi:integrase
MPKLATQQAETTYRTAKAGSTLKRISDGGGLYMQITPDGKKSWRYQYTRPGVGGRNTLSLGDYPAVTVAGARKSRDEAKVLLGEGIDPGEHRKATKSIRSDRAANSFEVVAREWFSKHLKTWAKSHSDKIIQRMEKDLFPWLGGRPIAEITAPEILATVRRVEGRGALDTAHRALSNCGQVFRYAVATGRAERDPTGDLRGALPPAKPGHFAAITDPVQAGALLRAMDAVSAGFVVKCALRLAPLLFVRPGELRRAEWAEIDFDKAEWSYFVSKTKTQHLVPLATQAVAILRELHPLTGQGRYVFPGARTNGMPMSGGAVNVALRRAGYSTRDEHTGHGFRAMARTILHQELGIPPEVIEHQLAHAVPDALGNAYNRTKFFKERRVMMQTWADCLDKLKDGADVLQYTRAA